MRGSGQDLTREVYEDAGVVREFSRHSRSSMERLDASARSLRGDRLIDIGCGPGRDALHFASLGCRVTAVDYSHAMIRQAQSQSDGGESPTFLVLDMRGVGGAFPAGSFGGAWVSAALLHVPEADVPAVLGGVWAILASRGRVSISLKAGTQGAILVEEHKYGREIEREFVFWEEDGFEALLRGAGFGGISCERGIGGTTGSQPTLWLKFTAEADK